MANVVEIHRKAEASILFTFDQDQVSSVDWTFTPKGETDEYPGEEEPGWWDDTILLEKIHVTAHIHKDDGTLTTQIDNLVTAVKNQGSAGNSENCVLKVKIDGNWRTKNCVFQNMKIKYTGGKVVILDVDMDFLVVDPDFTDAL